MKTLHMMLDGREVGQLIQDDHGSVRISAPRIPGAPRISLAFASGPDTIAPKPTRAYLAGLLPDSREVLEATAARLRVSPDSQFALLSRIGADCPGAIQFLDDGHLDIHRTGVLTPISDAEIAARLRDLRSGGRDWGAPGEHWSLGGAQSKIALRRTDDRWHHAEGTQATSHIIKPGIGGLQHQALIEHLSLRTLDHLGIQVARTEYLRFEEEPAIVVERFDRIVDDAGTLRRVHQEDLCQSTSRLPRSKYDVTATQAAVALRGGGATEADVLRFAQAIIANWVLAAPDAHAKNFSVFLGRQGVEGLAPLYDVSTGLGYPRSAELAMGIGGEKKIQKITGRHVIRLADDIAIDRGVLLETGRYLARLAPAGFAAASAETEMTAAEEAWASRTAAKLDEHCAQVMRRLDRTA